MTNNNPAKKGFIPNVNTLVSGLAVDSIPASVIENSDLPSGLNIEGHWIPVGSKFRYVEFSAQSPMVLGYHGIASSNASLTADNIDMGVCKLDTTASDSSATINTAGKSWHAMKNAVAIWKMQIDTSTNEYWRAGWYNASTIRADFEKSNANDDIHCVADGGSASSIDVDSGTNIDTSWHVYKVALSQDGSVRFYIDDMTTPVHTSARDVVEAGSFTNGLEFALYLDDNAAIQVVSNVAYILMYQDA